MSVIPKYKNKRLFIKPAECKKKNWDAIVIGSGIGGMSCAAALSKYGYKVLVLEQHYLPGGFTHMFARKGYKWDVGVHAIGEMEGREIPAKILKWLSNNQIEMVSLGNPFDRFKFPEGYVHALPNDKNVFIDDLKEKFPDQINKIDKYISTVRKVTKYSKAFFLFKSFPKWLAYPLDKIYHIFQRNWWACTTSQILNEIGIEGKLKTLLTVHWGYYGSVPNESSFPIHALTHTHFWYGAYYPRGGSKVFAETFLGNVIEANGEVVIRAKVSNLKINAGKAIGVELESGEEFFAKKIISATGAKSTIKNLLPNKYANSRWGNSILSIKSSPPYICLNLGFKGDIKKAGASSANQWLFNTWDNNITYWDFTNPDEKPHILYVSFPSLKDPDHDSGEELKETGECITFIKWDTFQKWENTTLKKREEDYIHLKKEIEQRILKELRLSLPSVMKHLDYYELSTPLTTEYFTRADKGAIYGLEASPERFTCRELRSYTPIKNFYMTGIDIASLGVVGGMTSGVLTAASINKKIYSKLI